MRTVLITGSDTGVGKTRVTGAVAALLTAAGRSVQIVKVVETGVAPGASGDAAQAANQSDRLVGTGNQARPAIPIEAVTLFSFGAALAPASASAQAGAALRWADVLAAVGRLPACDWRIYEGAGGIASVIDSAGHDWADFARDAAVDFVVLVVPDRLGAINQARLVHGRAVQEGLNAGVWLNAVAPVLPEVATSNRDVLRAAGVPIWAEQAFTAMRPVSPPAWLEAVGAGRTMDETPGGGDGLRGPSGDAGDGSGRATILGAGDANGGGRAALARRWSQDLDEREVRQLRRRVRLSRPEEGILNLADNDYLGLASDAGVAEGAAAAARRWGTSASASALVTGWGEAHETLLRALADWHGFVHGLVWTSGYAANGGVLATLPGEGDLVLADRLIHHSMIAGLLRSGARLQRYPHLDLERLERALAGADRSRAVFVVTESVFSMDGDYPDLRRMAELRRRYGFCWILDEAHGLGWYGPGGAGLAAEAGVAAEVDVLVGTLGKTLASGGAYALFREAVARERVLNLAGEFIYSTALPPPNAGAALAALERVKSLSVERGAWQGASRSFRAALAADGWTVPDGDSPIVPVRLDDEAAALSLAAALRGDGIWAAAVRPPTVPAGTSRLRLSLKRTFTAEQANRVRAAMARWRTLA